MDDLFEKKHQHAEKWLVFTRSIVVSSLELPFKHFFETHMGVVEEVDIHLGCMTALYVVSFGESLVSLHRH